MTEAAARLARIFVAEDNPADVYLVRMALQEHGIESDMRVADRGDEAVKVLDDMANGGLPDIILMDLNLPGRGGIDVLADLRETGRYEQVPVVIMTSSSVASDRQAAERLGINHYFRKPTHLENFLELGAIVKGLLRVP